MICDETTDSVVVEQLDIFVRGVSTFDGRVFNRAPRFSKMLLHPVKSPAPSSQTCDLIA
jgi:hypothetical protein